jgi:Family of unknown function (DUF6519)/Right handed beta helix region
MAADISRVRFDPLRDFAGVVLQQGRLLLDADFNDLVALLDRRLRAETCDLTSFGPDPDHRGVAWVPQQTPDGFRVELSGGNLTIGRGRMYVDGLLAENHGIELNGFDPLLREVTGTADTPYLQQPYWNNTPEDLPTGGMFLAYLDVWKREVTHLEDPELVEIAVGVDSTARWQTAWQVRLLEVPTSTTCTTDDDDIPGWLDLIRPSEGRLTNGTVDVGEDDPCELPPPGGYRGLENQTYRVEIHEGGDPASGNVMFKWSRENASVAMPVVEMVSSTVLRLASVGKDDVLRISTNDWVEITDDDAEYNFEPGAIRKVTVDDAERTIEFDDALPLELQPADAEDAAKRHLRVRRWDQRGVVRDATGAQIVDLDDAATSTGVIPVPSSAATQVVLEHGVVVSFSLAEPGGRFRRGDHWIFHARTADASIDPLEEAPPHGVHHHYARLGILTFPDSETSCRRFWPPLPTEGGGESCDCTVCVSPEGHESGVLTLQDAVELVKELGGGTICLQAGLYDIGPGVEIDGARSLRIRGQGPATILTARGEALTITSSIAVTVENLAIVSGAAAPGAVRMRNVILGNLQELVILSFGSEAGGGSAIELAGVELIVGIRRNVLIGRTGIGVPGGDNIGLLAAVLRIEDNVALAFDTGIDLGGASGYLYECRVSGNDVLGPNEAAIRATGAVAPGGSLDVVDNKLATSGTGIVVGADALVDANTISTWGEGRGTDGIVVDAGAFAVQPGHVRITGNRVNQRAGRGIALRTAVRTFMVKQNILDGVGHGIMIEGKGQAERVAVENNEVYDVGIQGDALGFGAGISVNHATSAAIVGNTVARVGNQFVEGAELAGIVAVATEDVRISGNVVEEFGPPEGGSVGAFGIAVGAPFQQASVADNAVRFRSSQLSPSDGEWIALLIQSAGGVRTSLAKTVSVVPLEDGAVVLTGEWAFAAASRAEHAGVASNSLAGGGSLPATLVRVGGDIVAESNQCEYGTIEEQTSAVVLRGSSVVASSNRLRGDRSMLILEVDENRFAAVGNLAPGGTWLGGPGGDLPDPWKPLNPPVS